MPAMRNALLLLTAAAMLLTQADLHTRLHAQAPAANPLAAEVDRVATEINPQVVAWRRDFHKNPELGNSEVRTAKVIADDQLPHRRHQRIADVARTHQQT